MPLYFVDYDLRGQRNYQDLYDALGKLGAVRFLESSWCFQRADTSAKLVRDYLTKHIDANDGLMVSAVSDWACIRTLSSPNKLV